MQQILNYILKNSILLLFLLLLGISLTLTIQSHSFHRSRTISSTNAVTGYLFGEVNSLEEYLDLKNQNDKLAEENAQLKKLLFNTQDTLNTSTTNIPDVKGNFNVIQSKVISNPYNAHENYLTINNGTNDGVKPDMGVISSFGVVGIVEKVSPKYATVISLLNTKFKLAAKIKKSNHYGFLTWDGKNAGYAQLIDVPRLAVVKKGDTIVTGGRSDIFPENIPIGTIDKVYINKETNYYTLNVRLFNDMTSLGHIYVIENEDRNEIIELETETKDE
ncbi:MAG: rod shape-determining protein MreC [Flavobacterium sp. MedPE-SWcel]|uniref:rod shape-determining protein MreC n=1 Tax=uncultured Flavobacterium sp. TaxID=165435 RepID=UPI000913E1AE|nr:rod shape-determining protein MreC [uncultured Flavobacterium sp.]OIQ21807.1 MAG: rod shape-determining protein MreC [Flavobacterium sp. MedPE-SWcel]